MQIVLHVQRVELQAVVLRWLSGDVSEEAGVQGLCGL